MYAYINWSQKAIGLLVSQQCHKTSRNIWNLIDLLFVCNKACFFCESERLCECEIYADHRDLKLAADGAIMTITSGLCLHKHAYY